MLVTRAFAQPRFDIERSMAFQRMGAFDATATCTKDRFTKLHVVDEQVVRHELTWQADELRVTSTGGDVAWAFPIDDDIDTFVAGRQHLPLRHAVREFAGLRLVALPWRFELACGFILQQRVTFREASQQWNLIVAKLGLRSELGAAFPSAKMLARVPTFALEALGIDGKRAATLHRLAREEATTGLFAIRDRDELRARLRAISGIGPWTTEMFFGFADGDPDAVPVGDLHLPDIVISILDRPTHKGGDERMLEVLEPYRGHRHRVIRLLWAIKFHRPDLLRRR